MPPGTRSVDAPAGPSRRTINGTAQADEVLIVNQLGTHRWTKEQMNALLDVSGQCV